jgi:hypothetical protein
MFVTGCPRHIPASEWQSFLSEQAALHASRPR